MTHRTAFLIPEDVIRERSYSIWQCEGCPDGRALDHWVRAKSELEAESDVGGLAMQLHISPPLRKPIAIVVPRPPISTPPAKSVSARISSQQHAVAG